MLANIVIRISSSFAINYIFPKALLTYGIKLKYVALVHDTLHYLQCELRKCIMTTKSLQWFYIFIFQNVLWNLELSAVTSF